MTTDLAASADFNPTMWTSAPITDLMSKTTVSPFAPTNPDLNYDPDQPDRMTVQFADGTSKEASVAYPLGAPQVPMTSADILRKFAENVSRSTADASVQALVGWLETPNILSHLTSWR